MTRRIVICLLSFVLLPLSLKAKQPQPTPISTEQQQQFTYYWYAAKQAIEEERYAQAYVLLEFCHAIKPDDPQTLYFLGVMYQGLNKHDEAKAFFEQAYNVQHGNRSEDLLNHLLQIYMLRGEWKKALAMQDELDKLNGYDAYSALTRYRIYALQNEPKKALQAIDKYLETDPTNLRFMLFRLELLEKTNAKQKVLYKQYEDILALDPGNLLVLNNYAYHLATHGGDMKRAERMSEITIREQPTNAVYLDTYGWILHLQGQDELAKFYLERALWNATDDQTKAEVTKHLEKVKGEK